LLPLKLRLPPLEVKAILLNVPHEPAHGARGHMFNQRRDDL
jgi:hypothetical protein